MLIRMPEYAQNFRCLAGDCPHSCCIGWEVALDEETAALYETVEGPLGEKLRTAMRTDEEGDVCFSLRGGRCPFLDGENLCEIHRALGQAATSVTCREHPRFIEDYGPFREITFSASCPEANRLLLASEGPFNVVEWEDGEPCEEADEWVSLLLPLRQRMMEVLADRALPLRERLEDFLRLARAGQCLLDGEKEEKLPELAEKWQRGSGGPPEWDIFPAALHLLAELEVLEPDWRQILEQAETAEPVSLPEELLERAAGYFAFRYLLKAVNDGGLLSRAKLCVFAVLVVERVATVCGLSEALRRFGREVEHSEPNVERLLEALAWGELPL